MCRERVATAASLTLLCPPMGEMPENAYDGAWRVWADGPDKPAAPPPQGYDPAIHGQWQPPSPWPVIGIHGVVLKDGRVLHWSYPDGNDGSNATVSITVFNLESDAKPQWKRHAWRQRHGVEAGGPGLGKQTSGKCLHQARIKSIGATDHFRIFRTSRVQHFE